KTGEGLGIDGGLGKEKAPSVNTIDVHDVDEYLEKITNAGGTVVAPKMTIPGVGYLAFFKDPQGNVFGIMKDDPSAK
ncbi:VOC family protein, partial [Candidatus Bathyarchaeota archaeon]|nr:VOC family protein [Candidatus Bathyarchaeota archaeon]